MFRGLLIMITQRLRKELLKIIFLKKIKTKKTCVRILIKFSRKAGLFLCFPCPDIIGILSGCCKNTLWLKDLQIVRIMVVLWIPSLAASQVFPSPKTSGTFGSFRGGIRVPTEQDNKKRTEHHQSSIIFIH